MSTIFTIDPQIVSEYGGHIKTYNKGDLIFSEGEDPRFFYQILNGSVRMFNAHNDGKEFTQGVFTEGCSFGEPPLFIEKGYPASAEALQVSVIQKISKENLFRLLATCDFMISYKLIRVISQRTYNKAVTVRELANKNPGSRILGFLESTLCVKKSKSSERILVPFTRQEIADFTGLRVETVIRTLKKMETEGLVEIKDRKLYY